MKVQRKNLLARISAVVAAALLTVSLPCGTAFAKNTSRADIDMSKKGSLTVTHLSIDEELMENVPSHIYLVATIDENGQYSITDEFKECFADQDFFNNGYDYDSWKDVVAYDMDSDSDNLYNYINSRKIKELTSGISDAQGKTYYKDLELGVYYVLSDKVVKGEYTHAFVNFVYPIPLLEMENGKLNVKYDVEASPKKSKTKNGEVERLEIYKRWMDSGNKDKRPSDITIDILCDGENYETVKLSTSNSWAYAATVEAGHNWSIEETETGKGYTASVTSSHNGSIYTYVVTNTYYTPDKPDKPGKPGVPEKPSQPDKPDQPSQPDEPVTPDQPDLPDNPSTPYEPDQPGQPGIPGIPEVLGAVRDLPAVLGARRLPQTGLLWWPLPILVIAGVLFIVKGIKKTRENRA